MRVHLIRKESIEDFVRSNAQARIPFNESLAKLRYADWAIPIDMKVTFPSIDILGKGSARVVFDIGGNHYRMICKYAFGEKQVHLFVCWIGTHVDSDKLCRKGEQYTVNVY